jgi:hypothetical protein
LRSSVVFTGDSAGSSLQVAHFIHGNDAQPTVHVKINHRGLPTVFDGRGDRNGHAWELGIVGVDDKNAFNRSGLQLFRNDG